MDLFKYLAHLIEHENILYNYKESSEKKREFLVFIRFPEPFVTNGFILNFEVYNETEI